MTKDKSIIDLYEILVIDNSLDKNIKNLCEANKYIKYLKQIDDGIFFAFNLGIKEASGKYIWFLNSGDIFANLINIKEFLYKLKNYNYPIILFKTIIYSKLLDKNIGEQPIFFPKNYLIYRFFCL